MVNRRQELCKCDHPGQLERLGAITIANIMNNRREPTSGRVPQDDGSYKTLKMSVGKQKMESESKDFQRLMYGDMMINGVPYCRRHLMIKCHLCQEDKGFLHDETNAERDSLGLRMGGDPELNNRSKRWSDLVDTENITKTLQRDNLILRYGRNHAETHPQYWARLTNEWKIKEREINDEFLAENDVIMLNKGASQCCYWACTTPNGHNGNPLLRCTGCNIVRYCCKEHQSRDWKFEHKGECTCSLPDWYNTELQRDRERNLRGDYSDYI